LVTYRGVVVSVLKGFQRIEGVDAHFDLSKLGIALPGFIDMHVHLRGLELSYKEDEYSGTRAAAKGGFTLVVDMPNTKPFVRDLESLRMKIEALERYSYVDYGLFIGVNIDQHQLESMLRYPAVAGIKIYPEDFEHLPQLARIVPRGTLLVVHAEHPSLISEPDTAEARGYRYAYRPIEAELLAIEELAKMFASRSDVKIHITHATSRLSVIAAKKAGFTVDTCPHYLYLTCRDEERLGCLAKVNPPLREPETNKELLNALHLVDAITTDHAPHSLEEKSLPFNECPSGIPSIEVATSLMLELVNRGFLTLTKLAYLMSMNPAKILGLDRWGCIEPGCIASYTVIDPRKEVRISSESFVSKARYSPYEGMVVRGSIEATIVRGIPAYVDEVFTELVHGIPLSEVKKLGLEAER